MGSLSHALRRPETYAGAVRELIGTAQCAVRYPMGMIEAGIAAVRPAGDPCHDTPVILVHGYAHNRSGWYVVERHLRRAGFAHVVTMNYNPLTADVPMLADKLARKVEAVRRAYGADKVHVVGHSLGGIILRWYVQERDGHAKVDTAITVASPHEGTLLAAGPVIGRTAQQLRPHSWVMRRLAGSARPTPVRWIAYYSNIDVLVQPGHSAMIRHAALGATNVLVKDHGHLSILLSPRLGRSIVDQLEAAEGVPGVADLVPMPVDDDLPPDSLPDADAGGL